MEFTYNALARVRQVDLLDRTPSTYVTRPDSTSSHRDVRQLDSVEALERSYLDLVGNPDAEIRAIARAFPLNRLIRNYFHTLKSCLRQGGTRGVRAQSRGVRPPASCQNSTFACLAIRLARRRVL